MSKQRIIQALRDSATVQGIKANATNPVWPSAALSAIVDTVFDTIADDLAGGHAVQLAGFGTFAVKERAERPGRNPQTGAAITVPASKTVGFKPAKRLKERL